MNRLLAGAALALGIVILGVAFAFQQRGDTTSSPGAEAQAAVSFPDSNLARATLAGGCFWCMEHPFDELQGVQSTISGFSGGDVEDPNYAEVSAGGTGHAEVVQVTYDSTQISYEEILEVYWHNVDPTQRNGQFCDHGVQYRTAIYYHNAHQRRIAEDTKVDLVSSGRFARVVTEIEPFTGFWAADEYHQDFYLTHPQEYQRYRRACGRDERLQQLWGEEAHSS